jgi:hypothetical protein
MLAATAVMAQTTGPTASAMQDPAQTEATQPAASEAAAGFDALDIDRNGQVSRDEANADSAVANDFDALDVDKDGALTRSELEQDASDDMTTEPDQP